ncbi:MAG: hypothetical protein Kow0092_05510 [Deferrisomatales bacterium]
MERERAGTGVPKADLTVVAALAVGLVSVLLLLGGDLLWRRTFRCTVPLLENLMEAKECLAEAYLWLEQGLQGGDVDPAKVAGAYDRAVAAVADGLAGASALRALPGSPVTDQALARQLEAYTGMIAAAKAVALQRCEAELAGADAARQDLQLLAVSHGLSLKSRAIAAALESNVRRAWNRQRALHLATVSLWMGLVGAVSWALYRDGRRKRIAEADLRRARDELEERVKARTEKLSEANERLHREVEERQRVERALRQSERELRHLSSRLLAAQEEERLQLARALHDRIGQALGAIKLAVEHGFSPPQGPGPSRDRVVTIVQEAMEEVRELYMGLRPSVLDDLGIVPAIGWLCRQFEGAHGNIRVEREVTVSEDEVPEELRIVVYRLLQEALSNVARHSRATRVVVTLKKEGERLGFVVEDDGVGFAAPGATGPEAGARGIGLRAMRERTEASGGSFAVETAPGRGTAVRASWARGESPPRPETSRRGV